MSGAWGFKTVCLKGNNMQQLGKTKKTMNHSSVKEQRFPGASL